MPLLVHTQILPPSSTPRSPALRWNHRPDERDARAGLERRPAETRLDAHLKLVLDRVTDLADTEAGFPHWLAKRRHDDALRLEAAAEVGA